MIIHGNAEFLPLADNSVDLTVTSPPYDNIRDYKGNSAFDFPKVANELYRITKDGGVVVWVVGDATINGSETGTSFKQALYFKKIGFNLHDTMIYHRERLPLTHNRYEQHFEYMFIFSNGKPNTFNPIKEKSIHAGTTSKSSTFRHEGKETGTLHKQDPIKNLKTKGNVWQYGVGYMKTTTYKPAYEHPAMFPEKLAYDHIVSWSNEGDTVLDCFAGSGTTAIACIRTNRKYILIEKEPEYIEIIKKRIKKELSQPKLI